MAATIQVLTKKIIEAPRTTTNNGFNSVFSGMLSNLSCSLVQDQFQNLVCLLISSLLKFITNIKFITFSKLIIFETYQLIYHKHNTSNKLLQ